MSGVQRGSMSKRVWTSILARGKHPLMKYGATGHTVRRLQRSLNAADRAGLAVTGVFEASTTAAVKRYQADNGLRATGVVEDRMPLDEGIKQTLPDLKIQ